MGKFGTYLGQHAENKTTVKFPQGKRTAPNKGVISRKVESTATSTKDVFQIRLSDELDILLKTLGPAEITQEKTKEVVYQGEFINFKVLFQNKQYAYNNTHFPS